jgi:integrase/recombinase XerD
MKPISNNTAHLILRKDAMRKDNTYPILLRLKIAGRKKDISLAEYCPQLFWDAQKEQVKRSYPDSDKINQVIGNKKLRADTIILRFKNSNQLLTLGDFEHEFGYEKTASFIDFVENEIKEEKLIRSKSEGTIIGYGKDLSKLKRYKPSILFSDITLRFLDDYEKYMRNDRGNMVNTIHRSLKFIRTFINRARKQGLTDKYPFSLKRLKTENTEREYLLEKEIDNLTTYYNNLRDQDEPKKTLRAFLFCCYTGIRFTDAKLLRYKNIDNGFLSIRMHKTKEIITMKLPDKAKAFLEPDPALQRIAPHPEQTVFKMPCNQVVNRNLKRSCIKAGIKKKMTFHCSRHTFGTLALTLNVPFETVSKLLGHKDLKQTSIYARIIDTKVNRDADMFNIALNIVKEPLKMMSTTICQSNGNGLQIKRC